MTSPISSAAVGSRLILAISFSGPGGSLALGRTDVLDEIAWDKRATASELATVHLTELLARNGVTLNDLTHILVNNGPGSFTGIRVGLNLARTLAFGLNLPLAAIDALTILAHKYVTTGSGVIALKAVRNHVYVAGFARTAGALELTLTPRSLERADPTLDAADVWLEGVTPDFDPHPTARDLLRSSLELPGLGPYLSWDQAKPLYIRGSEAEEKLRK